MYGFLGMLQRCIELGSAQLGISLKNQKEFHNPEVMVWKQMWSSTTCGFNGFGGSAMTRAYTVVIMSPDQRECVVFHNMRFAYCTKVTDEVWADIQKQDLKGAVDYLKEPY